MSDRNLVSKGIKPMKFFKSRLHTLIVLGLCALTILFCVTPSFVSARPTDSVIAQAPASIKLQRANTFDLRGDSTSLS